MTIQTQLDNALDQYAMENGDGFRCRDWPGAYEYQDEGFAIAERAVALAIAEEDLENWLEEQREAFPKSARYLIAVATDYRLAELAEEAKASAPSGWLAIAADITGSAK
jgi:hypothetical protein